MLYTRRSAVTALHPVRLASAPAGLAMAAFLVPMALLSFPAGRLSDRRGPRAVSRAGFALLLMAALLTVIAPSFGIFLLARAVAGAGASLVIVGGLKLIGAQVPVSWLGTALGVFVAGLLVGTVLAFDVITPVVGDQQWRAGFLAAAIVVAACAARQEAALRPLGPTGPSLAPTYGKARITASLARLLALTVVGYAVILAFTTWAPVHVPGYAQLAAQTTVILASILLAAMGGIRY
jgi:MFS family permease